MLGLVRHYGGEGALYVVVEGASRELLGLVVVRGGSKGFAAAEMPPELRGTTMRVALVDARDQAAPEGPPAVTYWKMDPAIAALPD